MIVRKRPILFIVFLLMWMAAPAFPGDGYFIKSVQVDLLKLLPPPPADDSTQTRTEITELVQIEKSRTPMEKEAAMADNNLSVFQLASSVLGPKFKEENFPLAAKFFEHVREDGRSVYGVAKDEWRRTRPFVASIDVKSCFGGMPMSGSYPSGHSTLGNLQAIVLSNMVPEKKAQIFERAAQYTRNRMVCGVHYRSDIEAGRIAATVIAAFEMQNPEFMKEFDGAKQEVRRALDLEQTHGSEQGLPEGIGLR